MVRGMIRIWIDAQTVKENLNEDGDFILNLEDFYFFKREEIANEHGYHLEFNSNLTGGFEIFIPYKDFKNFYNLISRKLMDYAEASSNC